MIRKNSRINWLRASVLGANDGIVSVAALIVGVESAANSVGLILTVGIAGLLAGAMSMALGEYVSVSSQLDLEKKLIEDEHLSHQQSPELELQHLAEIYQKRGLSEETARKVASELTKEDAFKAHIDAELGLDPEDLSNPGEAAIASAISFSVGGLIPLIAMVISPTAIRVPVTFVAVLIALVLTGTLSARLSGVGMVRPTVRVVLGGLLAMIITYALGSLFGVHGV